MEIIFFSGFICPCFSFFHWQNLTLKIQRELFGTHSRIWELKKGMDKFLTKAGSQLKQHQQKVIQ